MSILTVEKTKVFNISPGEPHTPFIIYIWAIVIYTFNFSTLSKIKIVVYQTIQQDKG